MGEPNPEPLVDVIQTPSTLQFLSSKQLADWLWQRKIETSSFPDEFSYLSVSFVHRCQNEILAKLIEAEASMPTPCRMAIARQVESVGRQMIEEYPKTNVTKLIRHVFRKKKWHNFVFSWLSCLKQKVGVHTFILIFERAAKKAQWRGLAALSESELSLYLKIWNSASKRLKLTIFDHLCDRYLGILKKCRSGGGLENKMVEKFAHFPRDISFLTELMARFDMPERKQIWSERWLDLIFGVSPARMEPLMRLCCDQGDQQFDQFKETWLARPDIIDSYYCLLIFKAREEDLEMILDFYSNDESKKLTLSKNILQSYFYKMPIPECYNHMMRIVENDIYLAKAIRMPEFEHLFRADMDKIEKYFNDTIRGARFADVHPLLTFLLPEEEVVLRERQLLISYFLENDYNYFHLGRNDINRFLLDRAFFECLNDFENFISRVFPSIDESNSFKKDVIFSPYMCDNILSYLSFAPSSNHGFITDLVNMCLSSERHSIPVWKQHFVEFTLQRLAKLPTETIELLCDIKVSGNPFEYIFDTEAKKAMFKYSMPIDELFDVLKVGDTFMNPFCNRHLNTVLKWWFNVVEDRVEFKMRKLNEYANDSIALWALLGEESKEFANYQNDQEKRDCVLRSLENKW